MREWAPEVAVEAELVRHLISDQFPELDASSARPFAEGWDNAVWAVEEHWAFRFPRRALAVHGVEREIAVLPRLAQVVPSPIPVPVFVGRPNDRYPWPFFGTALLPGQEAADAALSDEGRTRLGGELGRLLRALHAPAVLEAVDPGHALPGDPLGRTDMRDRVLRTRAWLAEIDRLGLWRPPESVERLLLKASELPPTEPSSVVHGDLHFRHVLVGRGVLAGVIDWGDVCRADPAVDLQLVWSFLPPEGREQFVSAYGTIREEQRVRARVLALCICAALCAYGRHERLVNIEREALGGLERTVVDWS